MKTGTADGRPDAERLVVGLLWHSVSSENLGVGALSVANVALLQEAAAAAGRAVEFLVMGGIDRYFVAPTLRGLEVLPISGKAMVLPSGFRSAVKRCDLIVDIGGGDSFADIYGAKRAAYLLATKAVVLFLGKPLILAPQTIGPFASKIARRAAERIIERSTSAFSRDAISIERIQRPAARDKVQLTSDVAFALPFDQRPRPGRALAAVNVSALLHHGGYSGRNQFGLELDYPRYVRELLAWLCDQDELDVALVPHVIAPGSTVEDDYTVSRRLAEEFGLPEPPLFADPSSAKSFISTCEVIVGSRMHACIAGVSTGTATIPVAYSRKFSGLFGSLGYDYTIDAASVGTEEALARTQHLIGRRSELRADAVTASERARARLDEYVAGVASVMRGLP
jgi:colanic acid/amylovoran biosynthesis protein